MCTAATYKTKDFYFGRTLDYDMSYGETVTVTPRRFPFHFTNGKAIKNHFAIIGMAHVSNDYPLYYDAMNEKGLCIAGLNFPGNAFYRDPHPDKTNVAQFELIPRLLSICESAADAVGQLEKANITGEAFSPSLPPSPLHWIIADRKEAFTVESVAEGLKIYKNPVGILTNNPPFDRQLSRLNDYMNLSPREPVNNFSKDLSLTAYSRGMGAMGLPGDLSSTSRFVRASFVKMNSLSGDTEPESISQFFHILGSVCQQRGCCETGKDKYEITLYSSCCNADKGIYYYTTYENSQINAVAMFNEDLDSDELISYPLIDKMQVYLQN